MAAKCADHPNYSGIRRPKKTPNNPEGCKECWRYRSELLHEQDQQAQPVKHRSKKAVDAQVRRGNQEFASGKLKVQQDADTGDYEIMYGTRCLAVVSTEDEVWLGITMFNEGMRFNGKDFVGERDA